MPRVALRLLPLLVVVALASCTVPPAPAPVPGPTSGPPAVPTGSTPVTAADGPGTGFGLLTAVRVAEQDGADRVVFAFESAVPEHRIRLVELPVTSDPVGEEVPLDGTAALQVSLIGASAFRELVDPEPAFPVAGRIPAGLPQVTELVNLGDFEGVLVWAVGVRERGGFTVSVLDGPPRLVIDVAHG